MDLVIGQIAIRIVGELAVRGWEASFMAVAQHSPVGQPAPAGEST